MYLYWKIQQFVDFAWWRVRVKPCQSYAISKHMNMIVLPQMFPNMCDLLQCTAFALDFATPITAISNSRGTQNFKESINFVRGVCSYLDLETRRVQTTTCVNHCIFAGYYWIFKPTAWRMKAYILLCFTCVCEHHAKHVGPKWKHVMCSFDSELHAFVSLQAQHEREHVYRHQSWSQTAEGLETHPHLLRRGTPEGMGNIKMDETSVTFVIKL